MQEQEELFETYELKGWNWSKRLYQILGVAVILNVVGFVFMAQANFLTGKTCDSPIASGVCSVLDTLYVGGSLLGTDTTFVSNPYDPTQILDSDEITYVNVGNYQPLTYPAGYFTLANPDQQQPFDPMMPTSPEIPGISTTPSDGGLINTTPILPTDTGDVLVGEKPSSPFGKVTQGKITNRKSQPKVTPTPVPTADDEKAKVSEEDEGKFNNKPLKDLGNKYADAILGKDIDVNAPFTIEVLTKLDENGKFINPRITSKSGVDEKMNNLAKEAIAAFSDSKLLRPLYELGGRDVLIIFSQDADNLQAIIKTKTPSEARARSMQSTIGLWIQNSSAFMKEGSDEAALLKKAQLGTEQNFFVINFLMSNEEKTQLIDKSLRSLKEKLKKDQSTNGLSENVSPNQKADK